MNVILRKRIYKFIKEKGEVSYTDIQKVFNKNSIQTMHAIEELTAIRKVSFDFVKEVYSVRYIHEIENKGEFALVNAK